MGDSSQSRGSGRNSAATNVITSKKVSGKHLTASSPKSFAHEPIQKLARLHRGKIGSGTPGHVAVFLLKIAALEAVRRFSRARYPFIWSGLQALQVFCYPPLKWVQRWYPFRFLVKGMKMLSRPLLVLSVATAFTDESWNDNSRSNGMEGSQGPRDSQAVQEADSDVPFLQSYQDTGIFDEASQSLPPTSWLYRLHMELESQGITLPERIDEDELHRFYTAAKGDFTRFFSSVKKTIRWREKFRILSSEELEMWSNLVFWHGFDVKHRPCLIVRLGLAMSLPSSDRPRFAQAVVSQVDYGVLHLVKRRNPRITVLVDCEGLSSLRFPMNMLRSCSAILQDNFPNLLGCLFVIRLPPVARVIAQTFIQVLKPVTRQKLNVIGGAYQKVLYEHLHTIPSYLGGVCTCTACGDLNLWTVQSRSSEETNNEQGNIDNASTEDFHAFQSNTPDNIYMNGNYDKILRSAVVGILIFAVLIALIMGIYDPESRPAFSPMR